MANIVEIDITAQVPWDWAGRLPAEEAACFASLLLNPVIAVRLEQYSVGYVPNEHGGKTSMYEVRLTGSEALSWVFMSRLVAALASVGTVMDAAARDVENNGGWETIEPEYYAEWQAKQAERKAARKVARR